MKKTLLITLACFMSLVGAWAQNNIEVQGNIDADSTWTSDIDTVKITGDLFVDSLATLSIEPGVAVVFRGSFFIDVEGSLQAIGTSAEPIIFTASDTSGYYNNTHEGWRGLDFVNTDSEADSSRFVFCEFYYGKTFGSRSQDENGGAIFIQNYNGVKITNSKFMYNYSEGNGGAVHVKNADILIESSVFMHNACVSAGGAVNVAGDAGTCTANIFNSEFKYNHGNGGAMRIRGGGNSIISGNVIQFNESPGQNDYRGGGGILFGGVADSSIIENNFIANNLANIGGGIKLGGDSSPILINNIIANNCANVEKGGGVQIAYRSKPTLINNTIVNNRAKYGGGIFSSCEIDSINIYNTIVYGNVTDSVKGAQVYIKTLSEKANLNFYNCNIEGDSTEFYIEAGELSFIGYTNNIDTLPHFANPTDTADYLLETSPEDWKILSSSPCLEAGDTAGIGDFYPAYDYFGNVRTIADIIDIGAYEYELVRSLAISAESTEITENQGTLQFEATATPVDAANVSVTWSVTDGTGSASIDEAGLLTASANGTVTVKAVTNDGTDLSDEMEITISNQSSSSLDANESLAIRVYPNPANSYVHIVLGNHAEAVAELIDLSGKKVLSEQLTAGNQRLDISSLNKGLYILRVSSQGGIATSRLVVQ